jgi:hypothetical protein
VKLKIKAVLSGLATWLPGRRTMIATGGTDSARYCYSAWMRHLILARTAGALNRIPHTVAELGPGDSIGIGLAALLSGAEKYSALDVVRYSDLKSNLAIFDELIELFGRRSVIPGDDEFPDMQPKLQRYDFPHDWFDHALLRDALDPARVRDIRRSVEQAEGEHARIEYRVPWTEPSVIEEQSVDMLFSQAVLEHVQDLHQVYEAMRRWLKPTGVMSHQIDYRCHGKADTWNGHWTYSDAAWKVVVGRRPYLLNRAPHSRHMALLRDAGFTIVRESRQHAPSTLRSRDLAPRFRNLPADDLSTCGAYLVAVPSQ